MSEKYIEYWGLAQHPFLLAPDSKMMCVTGQYFECLERLKYAIYTNKGGVLIVSEDAGLGKTTILMKLVDEMKEEYGERTSLTRSSRQSLNPMIVMITVCWYCWLAQRLPAGGLDGLNDARYTPKGT